MNQKKDTADVVIDLLCVRVQEMEAERDALVKQIESYEHILDCPDCLSGNLQAVLEKQGGDEEPSEGEPEESQYAEVIVYVPAGMNINSPEDLPDSVKQRLAEEAIEIDTVKIIQR